MGQLMTNKITHYAYLTGVINKKTPTEEEAFDAVMFARLLLVEAFYNGKKSAKEFEQHFGIKLFVTTEDDDNEVSKSV
jgi:hypothetical protein